MTMETSCPAGPLVHHAALEGGPSLEAQAAVQHGVAYHGRVIGDHQLEKSMGFPTKTYAVHTKTYGFPTKTDGFSYQKPMVTLGQTTEKCGKAGFILERKMIYFYVEKPVKMTILHIKMVFFAHKNDGFTIHFVVYHRECCVEQQMWGFPYSKCFRTVNAPIRMVMQPLNTNGIHWSRENEQLVHCFQVIFHFLENQFPTFFKLFPRLRSTVTLMFGSV